MTLKSTIFFTKHQERQDLGLKYFCEMKEYYPISLPIYLCVHCIFMECM